MFILPQRRDLPHRDPSSLHRHWYHRHLRRRIHPHRRPRLLGRPPRSRRSSRRRRLCRGRPRTLSSSPSHILSLFRPRVPPFHSFSTAPVLNLKTVPAALLYHNPPFETGLQAGVEPLSLPFDVLLTSNLTRCLFLGLYVREKREDGVSIGSSQSLQKPKDKKMRS